MELSKCPIKVVLASESPRRKAILKAVARDFDVRPVRVDESPRAGESAAETAVRLAEAKALAAACSEEEVVVAADTVVAQDGRLYGKPANAEEAERMLRELRGRPHEVVTGVAVVRLGKASYTSSVETKVWMRSYTDDEMRAYIAKGEPFDKAGGYAIQSRTFHPVEKLEGCYLNVVGLPLCELVEGLRKVVPECCWCWDPSGVRGCKTCPSSGNARKLEC